MFPKFCFLWDYFHLFWSLSFMLPYFFSFPVILGWLFTSKSKTINSSMKLCRLGGNLLTGRPPFGVLSWKPTSMMYSFSGQSVGFFSSGSFHFFREDFLAFGFGSRCLVVRLSSCQDTNGKSALYRLSIDSFFPVLHLTAALCRL